MSDQEKRHGDDLTQSDRSCLGDASRIPRTKYDGAVAQTLKRWGGEEQDPAVRRDLAMAAMAVERVATRLGQRLAPDSR